MTISLASLIVVETKAAIYEAGLAIANAIGLPVTSWQTGDPTRSLFHFLSEMLATRDEIAAGYIRSGFLDYAEGEWLKILAEQQFGVIVPEATAATTTVTLSNAGGGYYEIEAGDVTLKNSTSGKTYTNTTGGILASGPGTTLDITVVADEAGSDSSAAAGEIDELVTTYLGVTCSNATAAVGIDEQDAEVTRQQCRDRIGRLSSNGPKDAYSDTARDMDLTGLAYVPRVRAYADSDVGDVTVVLAGPSGAVPEVDRAAVELAILANATPLCITPTVVSATTVTVAVTYSLWVYKSVNKTAAEIAEEVEAALEQMFATRPIGGDIIPPATTGSLYRTLIESTIREVYPQAFRVSVSAPSGDTALTNTQVAVVGTVTPTITLVADPT